MGPGIAIIAGVARAEPCTAGLDEVAFQTRILNAQTAADQAKPELHRHIVADLQARLPCLRFAPTPREWSEYLVLEALMEFGRGGDWQTPLDAAIALRPSVDRGVGEWHPFMDHAPAPAAPVRKVVVPGGVNVYVDGESAAEIPVGSGVHLVQREEGGRWRTFVQRVDPVSIDWLVAPFPARSTWRGVVHAALGGGLGGGIQRRSPQWGAVAGAGRPVVPNRGWWGLWPHLAVRGAIAYGRFGLIGDVDAGLVDLSRIVGTHAQAFAGWTARGTWAGIGIGTGGSTLVEAGSANADYEKHVVPLVYAAATAQRWWQGGDLGLSAGIGPSGAHGSAFVGVYPSLEGIGPLRLGVSGAGQRGRFVQPDRPAATAWGINWRVGVEVGLYGRSGAPAPP